MPQAPLQNHDGQFVIPSPDGATAAASQFPAVSPTQFSIVDAPGQKSAPISGYSWLMLYKDQADKTKGTALVDYLDWLVTDGQSYATNVHYAKLPTNMVKADIISLKTVTSGGAARLPSNAPAPSERRNESRNCRAGGSHAAGGRKPSAAFRLRRSHLPRDGVRCGPAGHGDRGHLPHCAGHSRATRDHEIRARLSL